MNSENEISQMTLSQKPVGKFSETMDYFKKHWQLYIIFLLPALLLTIIFKYVPMGGILIAFENYNPIKGILGSEWVGLEYFQRFLSSPDFMQYLINTLKLSVYGLLWSFPVPIILAFLLNQIRSSKIKQKIQLILYMPNFVSVIVLCGIVRLLLSVNAPGNTTAHIVSSRPKLLTTRYVGMSPPPKNMVIKNKTLKKPRPLKSFLDIG